MAGIHLLRRHENKGTSTPNSYRAKDSIKGRCCCFVRLQCSICGKHFGAIKSYAGGRNSWDGFGVLYGRSKLRLPETTSFVLCVVGFVFNNSKHASCLASLACLAPPIRSFQTVVDCTGPIRSNPNLHRSNHPDSNRMQIEKIERDWGGLVSTIGRRVCVCSEHARLGL